MKFRDSNKDDYKRVIELYDSRSLPPYFNKMYRGEVAELNDKVVAFAGLSYIVEATIVVDKSLPTRLGADIMRLFMQRLKDEAKKQNVEGVYASTREPGFEEILIKHFGWEKVRMLFLSTENKNGSGT